MLRVNQKVSIKEIVKKKLEEKYKSNTELNGIGSVWSKNERISGKEGVSDRKKSGTSSRSPEHNSRKQARTNLDQF